MNKEEIRKALDCFEKDQFTDAKDILSKEIRVKKNSWLKTKLDLKEDLDEEEGLTKKQEKLPEPLKKAIKKKKGIKDDEEEEEEEEE